MLYEKRNKKIYFFIGLLILAVVAAVSVFLSKYNSTGFRKDVSYTISNVPYVGYHNQPSHPIEVYGDTTAAAISIAEYWMPGETNYVETSNFFSDNPNKLVGMDLVEKYFEKDGKYTAIQEKLNIDDLSKYINKNTRTPLFLFLALDENQPLEIGYHPARVLLGVDYATKKLVLHDVYLGNNLEISFDDYEKLWTKMRPDERNLYLIVQPIDLKNKLKEVRERKIVPYDQRGQVLNNSQQIFKNFALGTAAMRMNLTDIALEYLQRVKDDKDYEEFFPPFFKVKTLYQLASLSSTKNQPDIAMEYINKAIEMNHDLDKPFKDWPGFPLKGNVPQFEGQNGAVYRILGNIYAKAGDNAKAVENYTKALEIDPDNQLARERLNAVKNLVP